MHHLKTQENLEDATFEQRKRVRECEKRVRASTKIFAQLDHVLQNFKSSSGGVANDPTSIGACIEKLKKLSGLELGGDLFYLGIRLMNKRENRLAFIHMWEAAAASIWLRPHSSADVV
ncbi:hypothetical protein SESBI_23506 [Sesbania bispinosa]|nr:hypothetical protein SESBI_23506 [Sesbania bispinosa]